MTDELSPPPAAEEQKKKPKNPSAFGKTLKPVGNALKNVGLTGLAQLVGIPLGILGVSVPMSMQSGVKKPQPQQPGAAPAEQPATAEMQQPSAIPRLSDQDRQARALEQFKNSDVYKNLPEDQRTKAEELFLNGKGGTLKYSLPGSMPDGGSPDGKQTLHHLSGIPDDEAMKAFSSPGYAGEEYLADKNAVFKSIAKFDITPEEKMELFKAGQQGYEQFEGVRKKLNEQYGAGKKHVASAEFARAEKAGEDTSKLYVPIAERGRSLFPETQDVEAVIDPYTPQEPEPEPADPENPPGPDFHNIEEAHQAVTGRLDPLYRGIGAEQKMGRRGMGAGDGDINNAVLAKDEGAFQQAQAELQRTKEIERGLKNAGINTQLELGMRQFLHDTEYADPETRQSGYAALVQNWMSNPNLSPNAPGLSEEEKLDRVMLLQQAGSKLSLNTQASQQKYDREQFLTDTSNNVQAVIEMTAAGEGGDEENFGLMQSQMLNARTSMPPGQFNNFVMESYSSFWKTTANKKVQAAVAQAEETGGLVNVNDVIRDLSEDSEEMYFTGLNAVGFNDGGGSARGHIFQNSVYAGIIEARKTLRDYNEGVIKQQEGYYQVYNNNGYFEPAQKIGSEWRDKLDAAAQAGNVNKDFYFSSKDFFKPMAVRQDAGGADVVKAGGGNDDLAGAAADMIIQYIDNQEQGIPPNAAVEYLMDQYQIPDALKPVYFEKDAEGNFTKKNDKFKSLVRNTLINALVKKFQNPEDYKAAAGNVHRIQEMFADTDRVEKYFQTMPQKKQEELLKTIGDKDKTLDPGEARDMAAYASNIIWGRFIDELNGGMHNLGDTDKMSAWVNEIRKQAFSRYIVYAANAGALADQHDEMKGGTTGTSGLRLTEGKLAGWIKAQPLSGNPARYSSDQTAGKAGRETLDEDRDSKAAVDILAQLMTNLSEKTNTVFDETSNLQMNEVKYKDLPLNPYTQDHRFGKDEFGYDEAGRPMFETGDFRFVFVLNGKKIDAKVYEKGVEKETITDIEKKGLTQKSIKKSRP